MGRPVASFTIAGQSLGDRRHSLGRDGEEEKDAKLKADLEKQAIAYWKLAAERAKQLKQPAPPPRSK